MKWIEDLSDWLHSLIHKFGFNFQGQHISWWENDDYLTAYRCDRCGEVLGVIRTKSAIHKVEELKERHHNN